MTSDYIQSLLIACLLKMILRHKMSQKMEKSMFFTSQPVLFKLHIITDHMHKNVFSQSKGRVLYQFGRTEGTL